MTRWGGWFAGALVVVACGCSGDSSTADPASTTEPPAAIDTAPTECAPATPELKVDQFADAIAAVETERGGPQQYFEINSTSLLVNLFVA